MTEVTNRFNADNSKNGQVVDAEDWCLAMNVHITKLRTA